MSPDEITTVFKVRFRCFKISLPEMSHAQADRCHRDQVRELVRFHLLQEFYRLRVSTCSIFQHPIGLGITAPEGSGLAYESQVRHQPAKLADWHP